MVRAQRSTACASGIRPSIACVRLTKLCNLQASSKSHSVWMLFSSRCKPSSLHEPAGRDQRGLTMRPPAPRRAGVKPSTHVPPVLACCVAELSRARTNEAGASQVRAALRAVRLRVRTVVLRAVSARPRAGLRGPTAAGRPTPWPHRLRLVIWARTLLAPLWAPAGQLEASGPLGSRRMPRAGGSAPCSPAPHRATHPCNSSTVYLTPVFSAICRS
jgi:hypothetical protein